MTTNPMHDAQSIATDARRLLAVIRADLTNPQLRSRVSRREVDAFEANVVALESADGARSTTLHSQVAAGVHVAQSRAALWHFLVDVRDDAHLAFPKDSALQHAFGVGATASSVSTSQVRRLAEEVHSAAHEHSAEAAQIGLDTHGVHHLEDLIHALDGTDVAHVEAASTRHTNSTVAESLAHLVSAEATHIRLAARRVFRDDPTHLAKYARTLPRRAITPRANKKPATPAAT